MMNFYELSRVLILLGSVFLTRLTKRAQTEAWFDFSYLIIDLFEGSSNLKINKLVYINPV